MSERIGAFLRRLWFGPAMTSEELQARIKADTTDEDVDRFLPPSLRKYTK